jgi:pimeloyl-ACP methyl ester carboxylesterase
MRRRSTALLVSAVVLTLVAGCSSAGTSAPRTGAPSGSQSASAATGPLATFYDQKLQWTACGGGFDCTKVTVPLDYAAPDGKTVQLAVARRTSTKSQGVLVVNPGGPGGSGVSYVKYADQVFTPDLIAAYDLVGFDPRGVGASDPLRCVSDKQLDAYFAVDVTPDTPAEVARLESVSRSIGDGCAANSPDIAAHMSTPEAARDMDIIRAALGQQKLNYLGDSYGTFLGASYAELFPTRVGRMVLDGVQPSSITLEQTYQQEADGSDESLRRFVADCLPRSDCPLSGTTATGIARIQKLLTDLDAKPIPGSAGTAGRPLTEGLATYALSFGLYDSATGWPSLRTGLAAAFAGDGSGLLDLFDSWVGRQGDGSYQDNLYQAFFGVECVDTPQLGGPAHLAALAAQWKRTAPVFGVSNAWSMLPCWHWAPKQTTVAGSPVFHAKGTGPILVVSTRHDPATPYSWGVEVANELDNAALLTYDGDGHTAYHRGSDCIDAAVDAYLIHGTVPAKGTVCPAAP